MGLFLGWQAAVVLVPLAVVIYVPLLILGRWFPASRRFGPTAWLALGTLGWILGWARLTARFPGLG